MEKCTLWDKIPLAFCVIELVFDEKGHGVDFVFRYCNEMMADVEGIPISEMINRSFYEVFENGDKKWLVTYADVALNGNKHTLTVLKLTNILPFIAISLSPDIVPVF